MRQIILDTETTGLKPEEGHRIIEIGCLELIDRRFSGNNFHEYINPKREVEAGALKVHGITNEFLAHKPLFEHVIEKFIRYVQGAELIIHNADFDIGFLNYEFHLVGKKFQSIEQYCKVFDTLKLARKKHPGQHNSLDALCKRYKVDNTNRKLHGALLDAELLAFVYLAMTGGQGSLFGGHESRNNQNVASPQYQREVKEPLSIIYATSQEQTEHEKFLEFIKEQSGGHCLWE